MPTNTFTVTNSPVASASDQAAFVAKEIIRILSNDNDNSRSDLTGKVVPPTVVVT
jgi:hypothetical protein